MKSNYFTLLMLTSLLTLLSSCSQAQAGWFGWGDAERERQQREEDQRHRLAEAERQITTHRKSVEVWELATGSAAVTAMFLLIVGTALGTRTRHAARTQS